jgi:hypothetical protein
MVSKIFTTHVEPQNFENDWGLFIDIEIYENEIDSKHKGRKKYSKKDIETHTYFQHNDIKNDTICCGIFYCLATTCIFITSCLTYFVLSL